MEGIFLKCQEGPCRNLDFLLQFRGSESGVFVLYKNGPVGIKLQSKRGLSESNFRGERDLSESDFRAKGTCRKNAGMISVQVPTSLCMQNKLIIHSRYCFVEQYVSPREPNIYMGNLYLRDE